MIRYEPVPLLPVPAMLVHDDVETIIAYNPTLLCALPAPDRWSMLDDLVAQVDAHLELRPV